MNKAELNSIALTREELRSLRAFASRAKRHGESLDRALAQLLREWLWRRLREDVDPKEIDVIYPLLLAARRVALTERPQASACTPTAAAGEALALKELFGDFPPVRPFNLPPGEAEQTNITEN